MRNPFEQETTTLPSEMDLELIQDLERQQIDEIRKLRAHERLEIRAEVVLQPGSSSLVSTLQNVGQTSDISHGGTLATFPSPVGVGDVFRMTFNHPALDLPVVFARCLRCRLLREDAFEAAFSFFTRVNIGGSSSAAENDLLG